MTLTLSSFEIFCVKIYPVAHFQNIVTSLSKSSKEDGDIHVSISMPS